MSLFYFSQKSCKLHFTHLDDYAIKKNNRSF